MFATVIWTLWNRQNNFRLGKLALPLDKVLDFSREHLTKSTSSPWTTPEAHSLKVNFDGATFANDDTTGIGMVIRNDVGLVMASLTQKIPMPSSIIEVEVLP